jgi:hypothetical protein
MEQVFNKMLQRAVRDLELLEGRKLIQFKIFSVDGGEYGDLPVVEEETKKKKAASKYPHGEVRQYTLPFIESLMPDGIVSIPFNKYDAESIRGNVCSWCTTVWGKQSYSTTVNRDKQTVEIYRHALPR